MCLTDDHRELVNKVDELKKEFDEAESKFIRAAKELDCACQIALRELRKPLDVFEIRELEAIEKGELEL